jgi:hypothetical protein
MEFRIQSKQTGTRISDVPQNLESFILAPSEAFKMAAGFLNLFSALGHPKNEKVKI